MRNASILMSLVFSSTASGGFLSGNALGEYQRAWKQMDANHQLTAEAISDATQFTGYVLGVADTVTDVDKPVVCLKGTSKYQVSAVVSKYYDQHPEQWRLPAHVLVWSALMDAFPCPKS